MKTFPLGTLPPNQKISRALIRYTIPSEKCTFSNNTSTKYTNRLSTLPPGLFRKFQTAPALVNIIRHTLPIQNDIRNAQNQTTNERQFSDILPPRGVYLSIDAVLRYNLLARKCGALLAGTGLVIFTCTSTANWPCGLAC